MRIPLIYQNFKSAILSTKSYGQPDNTASLITKLL